MPRPKQKPEASRKRTLPVYLTQDEINMLALLANDQRRSMSSTARELIVAAFKSRKPNLIGD